MSEVEPGAQQHFTTEFQSTSPRRRTCTRCGCIAAAAAILLIVIAVVTIRVSIRKSIPADAWPHLQEFETRVISLPAEWHQPAATPTAETISLHQLLGTRVEELRQEYDELLFGDYTSPTQLLSRMRAGEPLTADEETTFAKFLADLQPLLDETSRTVALPGYTSDLDLYTTDTMPFLQLQVFAKLAGIAALQQAHEGNCYQAMETAILPIRVMERPTASTLIQHLISIAITYISSYTLDALAVQCSDPAALQHGLQLMTQLRTTAFPGEIANWRYGETIGKLRHQAAAGYDVDLSPQTMAGYVQQATMHNDQAYWNWIIENMPESDPRVAGARARLQQIEQMKSDTPEIAEAIEQPYQPGPFVTGVAKLVLGMHPYAFLYSIAIASYDESETRAYTAMAAYDLTRLHLAHRLAEVQGTAPSEDTARAASDLTTYLDPVPEDPFTSAPFQFSQKLNKFYSAGPDEKNGNAEVPYDATNGTVSAGDLWMQQD